MKAKPVPFKWRDSVDVPMFLVKLNEIKRRPKQTRKPNVKLIPEL